MEGLGPLRRVVARYSAATRAIYQGVEWRDGLGILQEDAPSLRAGRERPLGGSVQLMRLRSLQSPPSHSQCLASCKAPW